MLTLLWYLVLIIGAIGWARDFVRVVKEDRSKIGPEIVALLLGAWLYTKIVEWIQGR